MMAPIHIYKAERQPQRWGSRAGGEFQEERRKGRREGSVAWETRPSAPTNGAS